MSWDAFKTEFEEAGEDIHLNDFIVKWEENVDVFDWKGHEGHVVVSSPFLTAAAIHFEEVVCDES